MILVDVEVPLLDKVYDMQLDEYTPIAFLVEDVTGIICQKEKLVLIGESSEMTLWNKRGRYMFEAERTLKDYGIRSGQTLILI